MVTPSKKLSDWNPSLLRFLRHEYVCVFGDNMWKYSLDQKKWNGMRIAKNVLQFSVHQWAEKSAMELETAEAIADACKTANFPPHVLYKIGGVVYVYRLGLFIEIFRDVNNILKSTSD